MNLSHHDIIEDEKYCFFKDLESKPLLTGRANFTTQFGKYNKGVFTPTNKVNGITLYNIWYIKDNRYNKHFRLTGIEWPESFATIAKAKRYANKIAINQIKWDRINQLAKYFINL